MEHGVRLTVAYDGGGFAGYQCQPAERTVQGVLEAALARITQHPVQCRGASRTDAGVHAQGQVVAFATTRALTPERWLLAANRYLPADLAVQAVSTCAPDYNPRYDAIEKIYRYQLYLGFGRHPLLRRSAWHLGRDARRQYRADGAPGRDVLVASEDGSSGSRAAALDLEAMRRAATLLHGTHDFRAFRSADDVRERSVRTLHQLELLPDFQGQPGVLAIEVRGSAFMKHMVRILVGTLVAVGRGRLTETDVERLLSPAATRHPWSETAPAHGLCLVRIRLGRLRDPESR